MFDPDVLKEFKYEADEMLNESEDFLLALEKEQEFEPNFNGIFRAFHSLKGAAGMFEINPLQEFMHTIEGQFESLRTKKKITRAQIDYFLQAIDSARSLLDQNEIQFDTTLFDKIGESPSTPNQLIEEPTEQKEKAAIRIQKETKKKRGLVYVVDDEEFIKEELCDILGDFDFSTKGFTNPADLLAEVKKEQPDLVCTDLKMPEMSGMELLKKIRAEKVDCPVIFITGFVDNKLLTEGLDEGASGFLEKPFEEHQVVSLAKQAVDRHQTKKLLNRSINYILYQFNDLDRYLQSQKKEVQRANLRAELEKLLTLKKEFS